MSSKLCSSQALSALTSLFLLFCNNVLNSEASPLFNISFDYENSTDVLQNDENDLTFEDVFPDYINSNLFCDDIACKETYETARYPYKKIMEVVNSAWKKSLYPTPRLNELPPDSGLRTPDAPISSVVFQESIDSYPFFSSKSNFPTCEEIYRRIYPIKGKSTDGKWYYIVNVKDFQQRTDIITCNKSGASCNQLLSAYENYQFVCKQTHTTVTLSTIPYGGNITTETMGLNTFDVPSGCSCKRTRRDALK